MHKNSSKRNSYFWSGGIDVSKHSKERWRKLGVHNHEPTPSPEEDLQSTTQRFNKVALNLFPRLFDIRNFPSDKLHNLLVKFIYSEKATNFEINSILNSFGLLK